MRKRTSALLSVLLVLLLSSMLGACQHVVTPPTAVANPVRVYVIDYGRHASLALPAENGGSLLEWSWGDWNWFALERTGVLDGLQALIASPQSTLSRRLLAPAAGADELAGRLSAQEVLALDVERGRAQALLSQLDSRWRRRVDQGVTEGNGRTFVPDEAQYSLFNNSVHELARWLEALGAELSGFAFTADFELREARQE